MQKVRLAKTQCKKETNEMRGKRQTNREEGQIMVTLMAEWEIKWSFFSGGDALSLQRGQQYFRY